MKWRERSVYSRELILTVLWLAGSVGLAHLLFTVSDVFVIPLFGLTVVCGFVSMRVRCPRCGYFVRGYKERIIVTPFPPRQCPQCGLASHLPWRRTGADDEAGKRV